MTRLTTCPRRPRGVALALAVAMASLLTFAVVKTAESLADLAAAVHLSA